MELEEEGMLVTETCPKLNLSNQKRGRLKKKELYLLNLNLKCSMHEHYSESSSSACFISPSLLGGQPWSQLHVCIWSLICSTDSVRARSYRVCTLQQMLDMTGLGVGRGGGVCVWISRQNFALGLSVKWRLVLILQVQLLLLAAVL